MGARQSSSSKKAISVRSLKRQVSDFILTDSVAKSPKELCDNEVCLSDDEDLLDVDKHTPPNLSWLEALEGIEAEHTPLSPNLSWLADTPSTAFSINCDADAYKILMGRENSITVSEFEISRPVPCSPEPELQLSLSPRSDVGEGSFFPPTPRGFSPRASRSRKKNSICTPTDVRRLSAQNTEDLQHSPKGARLSRRGGLCAFHESQVPEMIRTLRKEGGRYDFGALSAEGEMSQMRISIQDWTSGGESNSSELLSPPMRHQALRTRLMHRDRPNVEFGGSSIPF